MRIVLSFVTLAAAAVAQAPEFAEPVRLRAGDSFLGENRLFPSPVSRDMNGDGRADVVVGDLLGRITVALRNADGTFAAETKLKAADGTELDFHNW